MHESELGEAVEVPGLSDEEVFTLPSVEANLRQTASLFDKFLLNMLFVYAHRQLITVKSGLYLFMCIGRALVTSCEENAG